MLVLTTESIRLVHSSDPGVEARGHDGWLPADKYVHDADATVIEVRALSGIEYAHLSTVALLADQMCYAFPLALMDKAKGEAATGWRWNLAVDLHAAINQLSNGGTLPLVPARPEGETAQS